MTFFKKSQEKHENVPITVAILCAPLLVSDGRVGSRDRPFFFGAPHDYTDRRGAVRSVFGPHYPAESIRWEQNTQMTKRSASAPNATNEATGPENRALVQARH